MPTNEIIEWIRVAREKGYNDSQIEELMLQNGYDQNQVNEALGKPVISNDAPISQSPAVVQDVAPKPAETPKKKSKFFGLKLTIIIILLLGIAAYGAYHYYTNVMI